MILNLFIIIKIYECCTLNASPVIDFLMGLAHWKVLIADLRHTVDFIMQYRKLIFLNITTNLMRNVVNFLAVVLVIRSCASFVTFYLLIEN